MPKTKTATQAQYEACVAALAEAKARQHAACDAANGPNGHALPAAIAACEAEVAYYDADLALYPIAVRYADELIVTEAASGDPDSLLANPQNIVDDLTRALAEVESARLVWEEKKAAVFARREAAVEAAQRIDARRSASGLPETRSRIDIGDPRIDTSVVLEALTETIKHGSGLSRDVQNGIRQSRMEVRERLNRYAIQHQREQEQARSRAEAEARREADKESQRLAQEAERLAWRKKCDDEQARLKGLVENARNAE